MEPHLGCEREEDGRRLAGVPQLAGVPVHGSSANEATAEAEVPALRVLAEQLEQREAGPQPIRFVLPTAWIIGQPPKGTESSKLSIESGGDSGGSAG